MMSPLLPRSGSRATSLIGPETYPRYVRALRVLGAIVLPVVYVVHAIGYWLRGESLGDVIFGPLGITLTVTMYLTVFVTLLFVVLDRFGEGP